MLIGPVDQPLVNLREHQNDLVLLNIGDGVIEYYGVVELRVAA